MVEVNYDGLNDYQRGIKRGVLLATRHFLENLPLKVKTNELIVKTVEYIWKDYCEECDA